MPATATLTVMPTCSMDALKGCASMQFTGDPMKLTTLLIALAGLFTLLSFAASDSAVISRIFDGMAFYWIVAWAALKWSDREHREEVL